MAGIALSGGGDMRVVFAWLDHTIMASGALTEDLLAVHECDDQPGVGRGMAEFAGLISSEMTDIFTGCTDPVMTAFTIIPHAGMGEIIHPPAIGGMTEVAGFRGLDMGSRFAGCANPVMAGLAGAGGDVAMIEIDQQPTVGDMAGFA